MTSTEDHTYLSSARRRNIAAVRSFLRLLEDKDIDSWIELWADDAEQFYPFGTEMFPRRLAGKAAIHDRWKNAPGLFETLSFPIQELWTDRDAVIVRFESDSVLRSGRKYRNTFVSVFKFDDTGKIREYREYFDPIIAGVDFRLAEVTYLTPGD
jgi:ketosteroid isomerase-like protein